MRHFIKIVSFIGIFVVSQIANPDSITDTYTTGDTLTASMLDNIKSAVNDNDSRMSALESAPGASPDFTGYGTPFAADGASKNVVVLKELHNDGSGFYVVRSAYANSTEQISINGVMTTRPFILNYVSASFDTNGVLTSLNNVIEAPLTTAYLDYVTESSTYNISTGAKTVTGDTGSALWVCDQFSAIATCDFTVKTNGVPTGFNRTTQVFTLLGSGTIGLMPFSDLRGENRHISILLEYQVRAKGIGTVIRMRNRPVEKVIYYNVNGATGGSLSGTPFEAGLLFAGVFF